MLNRALDLQVVRDTSFDWAKVTSFHGAMPFRLRAASQRAADRL